MRILISITPATPALMERHMSRTASNDDSRHRVICDFGKTIGGDTIDAIIEKQVGSHRILRRRDGEGLILVDDRGRVIAQMLFCDSRRSVNIPGGRYHAPYYREFASAAAQERAFLRQAERYALWAAAEPSNFFRVSA